MFIKYISTIILAFVTISTIAATGTDQRPFPQKVTYYIETTDGSIASEETLSGLLNNTRSIMQIVINVDHSETMDEEYGDETDSGDAGDPIGFQIVLNLNANNDDAIDPWDMHDYRYHDEGETPFDDRRPRREIVIDLDHSETMDEEYGDETDSGDAGDPIGLKIIVNDASETMDEEYGDETDSGDAGDPIGAAIIINLSNGNGQQSGKSITINLPPKLILRQQ